MSVPFSKVVVFIRNSKGLETVFSIREVSGFHGDELSKRVLVTD